MGKLTVKAVEAAKPKDKLYKLSDGRGLQIWVHPDGAKRWRFSYRHGGKQRTLALGVFDDVTLAGARDALSEARGLLGKGIDPAQARAVQKVTGALVAAESFEAIGREWYSRHMENKSESYRVRTGRILKNDLYPQLGKRPVSEIEPPELLAVLRKIEARTVDIAHRAKQVAGQIFSYAIQTGRAERNPSSDLSGALKSKHKQHHAAITDPPALGKLLLAIQEYSGSAVVRTAMQINALTFQRPGLVRAMEWEHVDLESGVWSVPAEAMQKTHKADGERRAHIVPLATQAVALLTELHRLTGRGRYVFPGGRGPSRCLSENGMRVALRTMGYSNDDMTSHGWRATARTLLDEELNCRVDYVEHQLAHAVKDPNGRAYNRTKFLDERTTMMQRWADYLDTLRRAAAACNG